MVANARAPDYRKRPNAMNIGIAIGVENRIDAETRHRFRYRSRPPMVAWFRRSRVHRVR